MPVIFESSIYSHLYRMNIGTGRLWSYGLLMSLTSFLIISEKMHLPATRSRDQLKSAGLRNFYYSLKFN